MGNKAVVHSDDFTHILITVMRIVLEQIATTPSERAGRNWFSAVPSACITVIVSNLQIAVIEEPLIVLLAPTAHVVVAHRDEWRSGGVGIW